MNEKTKLKNTNKYPNKNSKTTYLSINFRHVANMPIRRTPHALYVGLGVAFEQLLRISSFSCL